MDVILDSLSYLEEEGEEEEEGRDEEDADEEDIEQVVESRGGERSSPAVDVEDNMSLLSFIWSSKMFANDRCTWSKPWILCVYYHIE
jgi:hypothetical protein